MDPAAAPPDDSRDWVFWSLLAAAVLSRLVWVLWVHPPREHVFSDMAHYVHRAQLVAEGRITSGMREMVWQAWGTHMILAIPMWLLGSGQAALEVAGLMWAGFSVGTVMLGHALARRVLPAGAGVHWRVLPAGAGVHWPALAVGVLLLGWFPLLSHTGFFVSETPYACVLLAMTLAIVRVLQDGRGAAAAGLWGALAFALRPQVAVFFVLLAPLGWVEWARARRDGRAQRITTRALVWVAAPLLIVLLISMVRVRVHTGELGGVSENASMNLTAGRCHNIVTRSWTSQDDLDAWTATGEPAPVRRVSLPGFRALGREGPDHPLALQPALGGEFIDLIGYIGDRRLHRDIRRRCYAATGVLGQLRYGVTNVALLWVVARPWPESSDRGTPKWLPVAVRGRDIAAALAPLSLLGLMLALWAWARGGARGGPWGGRGSSPEAAATGLAVCALQLASLWIVAAVFFGTPRLRTPYDPYALILTIALVSALATWATQWLRARRT